MLGRNSHVSQARVAFTVSGDNIVLEFLGKLRGLSAGEVVDTVRRKVYVKRWQRRDHVSVRCAGRTARLQVRKASTDVEVVWQCFIGNQYEVPTVPGAAPLHYDAVQAAYANIIKSGKTPLIIDCGANMGASTAWFDMRYPKSKIVAIEPAAANLSLLQANCGHGSNITIVEAGVGPEDNIAYLQDNGGGHWGYQTGQTMSDKPVKIVSLAKLIDTNRDELIVPFILKIDVEGAEKDLFEHSLESIAAFPVIIFEPHDFYMPGARTASPFFKFHAEAGRDFSFHYENVFSLDMNSLCHNVDAD